METTSGWSLIEPDAPETELEVAPAKTAPVAAQHAAVPSRSLLTAIVAAIMGIVAVAIWMTMPSGGVTVDAGSGGGVQQLSAAQGSHAPGPVGSSVLAAAAASGHALIVDVEGAVVAPGVHSLPEGSRVSDAIQAAGGYALTVDIAAASSALNLAARLTDGQQIHVPVLGEAGDSRPTGAPASGAGAPSATTTALIDINHASADELDSLPGIGPVTAQKIIDARTEAPFASVDELESRGVVGASTFEKLRDLITAQ